MSDMDLGIEGLLITGGFGYQTLNAQPLRARGPLGRRP